MQTTPSAQTSLFGGQIPTEGQPITLKEAISQIGSAGDQFLKIEGQITEVCQAKGCWMILVEGDTYARVTFEDYGFFVPTETSMQRSVIYGQLSERTLSDKRRRTLHKMQALNLKLNLKAKLKSIQFSLEEYSSKIEVKGSICMGKRKALLSFFLLLTLALCNPGPPYSTEGPGIQGAFE